MKKAFFVLGLSALGACAAPHNAAAVRQAEAGNVWRCQKIEEVVGAPSGHGMSSLNALADSRAAAMQKAAELGGDTVVWANGDSARAMAYKCRQ